MPHTPNPMRCGAGALVALGALGALAALAHPAVAQPVETVRIPTLWTAAAPGATLACAPASFDDLAPRSDEFAGDRPLTGDGGRWRWFHEEFGWPDMLRRAAVGVTRAGHLTLEPEQSGWFADYHAPFLYQPVRGDFDVTARVRAVSSARAGDSLPRAPWSLVGLMVRAPRPVTPQTWMPRRENWLFITTGTAEAPGVPVFETKSTVNSGSNLKLRPARGDWMELRVVRLREVFLLLSRMPGERWRVRERLLRRDMPWAEVQVGLVAYSDGTNAPPEMRDPFVHNAADKATRARLGRPDLRAEVDYVRFRRPPVLRDVAPDWLVDHEVTEAALLRFLECGEGTP